MPRLAILLRLLAVAALLSGVFFRLHHLDRKIYWNDEIWTSVWLTGQTWPEFAGSVPKNTTAGDLRKILETPVRPGVVSTAKALALEDSKQPLLYMVLVRLWADAFGRSPGTLRLLSALLGLLALVPMFLLCRRLSTENETPWIAVALMAASPFHILYAQEARPYTLWSLAILTSGWLLLRAIQTNTRPAWILYGASVGVGLYAHTLFALVLLGQALFVMFPPGDVQRDRKRAWLASVALGLGLFLPWALVIATRFVSLAENSGWIAKSQGLAGLVSRWPLAVASLFFDLGPTLKFEARELIVLQLWGVGVVLWIVIAALRGVRGRTGFFTRTLMLPAASLMIFDLAFRGGGFSTPRFMTPLLLGIQLAVALYIASRPRPLVRVLITTLLVGLGLFSAFRSDASETWWTKYLNFNVSKAAIIIQRDAAPLIVGRATGMDLRRVLSLSLKLRPDVEVRFVQDDREISELVGGDGDGHPRTVYFYGGTAPVVETARPPQPIIDYMWKLGH